MKRPDLELVDISLRDCDRQLAYGLLWYVFGTFLWLGVRGVIRTLSNNVYDEIVYKSRQGLKAFLVIISSIHLGFFN